MTQNVMTNLEVRHKIDVLLATARDGVSALESAATLIHIPTREMAKIDTAMKKMREAAVYIEDRAHNIQGAAPTKSALKEALKGATQEQIERAYAILSGQNDGPKGRSSSTESANDSVDETTGEEEAYLPPPEWNEG